MKTTRLFAAAAAFIVAGSALASNPSDRGPALSTANSVAGLSYGYDLSVPGDNFGFNPGAESAFTSPGPIADDLAAGGQAHAPDLGTLWVLTDLSYELSGTGTTIELGFGWYGVGGGINFYPQGGRSGLMFSARVGYLGAGGVAVNGSVNYVGHFTPSVVWRLGVGVQYQSNTGWYDFSSDVYPIGIADIGFRL